MLDWIAGHAVAERLEVAAHRMANVVDSRQHVSRRAERGPDFRLIAAVSAGGRKSRSELSGERSYREGQLAQIEGPSEDQASLSPIGMPSARRIRRVRTKPWNTAWLSGFAELST